MFQEGLRLLSEGALARLICASVQLVPRYIPRQRRPIVFHETQSRVRRRWHGALGLFVTAVRSGPGFQDVINPRPEGRSDACHRSRFDTAVAAASNAFLKWRTSRSERAKPVAPLLEDRENSEELARICSRSIKAPLNGLDPGSNRARSPGRVTPASCRFAGSAQDGPEGRVELHRKPIGVVGSITPWNWPVMIACWHIIPAIRAGNTVVIKPSPLTPLSTIRLVELMNEKLPPGVVNVVTGENEIGALMSAHPGIAKVTFTGSTATGRKIMQSAATTLKRLTLELGGNDAGVARRRPQGDARADLAPSSAAARPAPR